jgi:hypothetical protein
MQYEIPSPSFDIGEAHKPIEEIYRLTNQFNTISNDTKQNILNRICSRQKNTIYGTFKAPSKPIADKINGTDGYFLKKTSEAADVDFIWYDDKNADYIFWGPSVYKVTDAMKRVRSEIIKYVKPIDAYAKPIDAYAKPIDAYAEPNINTSDPDYTNQFQSIKQSIFSVIDEEDISDADIEYIAIVRESFEDDEYSNLLFERMDNGILSKSEFIRIHERYTNSLCSKHFSLVEKLYAIASNKKN